MSKKIFLQKYLIIKTNNIVLQQSGFSEEELECLGLNCLFDSITVDRIHSIYKCFECDQIRQTISGDMLQKEGVPFDAEINVNFSITDEEELYWLTISSSNFDNSIEDTDTLENISA